MTIKKKNENLNFFGKKSGMFLELGFELGTQVAQRLLS